MFCLGVGLGTTRLLAQSDDSTGGSPVEIAQREVARGWSARTVRTGDAVVYPFGRTQPTVTCAPLRACVIELQAGESVLGMATGDAERWLIERSTTGPGGRKVLVIIKPTSCALTTNLVISTDRRVYDLTMTSPGCVGKAGAADETYTRHVAFYYPDDLLSGVSQDEKTNSLQYAAVGTMPDNSGGRPESLNFGYHWLPDRRVRWNPAQVYDDGVHTYVKLSAAALHDELPALFLIGQDGKLAILNYTVLNGDTFVSDRVLTRAVLIAGANGHDGRVEIINDRASTAHGS